MGDGAESNQAAGVATGKAALWTRPSFWKSALVIAPLAGTALFIATGTSAQTSGSATPPTTDATTVAPKPTPEAARHRGGPKGGGRDKEMTGRTAAPDTSTDPATPTQKGATVAPIDAPDAARKEGPKGRSDSGRTEAAPEPDSAPVEERRREGPKGDGGSGRTEAPAPDTQPDGRRKEGPKGTSGSDHDGRTEAPPAPDTQPTGRRKGPKGDVDHGRTSTTPLIIGALGTAAVLALVISSGNDRPASP